MEANQGIESYELLLAVCREKGVELVVGYKQMRDLLERICRSEMQNESLQMTDLSARISFVGAKTGLTYAEQNRFAYIPSDFQSGFESPACSYPGESFARRQDIGFSYP